MESFTMNIDEIPLIHLQIIRYNLYGINYTLFLITQNPVFDLFECQDIDAHGVQIKISNRISEILLKSSQ